MKKLIEHLLWLWLVASEMLNGNLTSYRGEKKENVFSVLWHEHLKFWRSL